MTVKPSSRYSHVGARRCVTTCSALVLALLSLGCTRLPFGTHEPLHEQAGPALVGTPGEQMAQWQNAKQTLERRCVVCHGCYDSPCQLTLSSFEGIARGAHKEQVYDGSRLLASEPTRLHVDAQNLQGWRAKGFVPVLPEGNHGDPSQALLVRMLELKRQFPLPLGGKLPKGFELGLDRRQQCPTPEEFRGFAEEHPSWGMPYALPGLDDAEHTALVSWVKSGAPHQPPAPLAPAVLEAVERWERFFNQTELKAQLTARYVYEHLFLASLYFQGVDENTFFRLVRSRTPPGQPVDEIATRRPYEWPGPGKFYYRLWRRPDVRLAKTHMPYPLSEARLALLQRLFLEPDYEVRQLPGYDRRIADNPFLAFADLPVRSRYRFMLEEAHFTISGFIKGPVCRGQVALNVIRDRFWISFVDPDSPVVEHEDRLFAREMPDLTLPAEQGSNGLLVNWRKYAKRQIRFLAAKSKYLSDLATSPEMVTLAQVWDGDGENPNAALTVMRHFDSASVVKGFVGGEPKTAWVVGFALLERIHYLLVAGFDVFGNIGHQLHSRLYMDFLRMEAEHNFVVLLPRARRRPVVDAWYRDTKGTTRDQVYGKLARFDQETGIRYQTRRPERELLKMLSDHLRPVLTLKHGLGEEPDERLRQAFTPLALLGGERATRLPESSFIEVRLDDGSSKYFTMLRDSGHSNVSTLFREAEQRRPKDDQVTLLRGVVGAYPNALWRVRHADVEDFVAGLSALDSDDRYDALRARYGVRRTDPQFWAYSDALHEAYGELEPIEAGLLDFNRLDAR